MYTQEFLYLLFWLAKLSNRTQNEDTQVNTRDFIEVLISC